MRAVTCDLFRNFSDVIPSVVAQGVVIELSAGLSVVALGLCQALQVALSRLLLGADVAVVATLLPVALSSLLSQEVRMCGLLLGGVLIPFLTVGQVASRGDEVSDTALIDPDLAARGQGPVFTGQGVGVGFPVACHGCTLPHAWHVPASILMPERRCPQRPPGASVRPSGATWDCCPSHVRTGPWTRQEGPLGPSQQSEPGWHAGSDPTPLRGPAQPEVRGQAEIQLELGPGHGHVGQAKLGRAEVTLLGGHEVRTDLDRVPLEALALVGSADDHAIPRGSLGGPLVGVGVEGLDDGLSPELLHQLDVQLEVGTLLLLLDVADHIGPGGEHGKLSVLRGLPTLEPLSSLAKAHDLGGATHEVDPATGGDGTHQGTHRASVGPAQDG